MQFMIIERYRPGKEKEIYRRFEEKGRMLPEGLVYINSWINETVTCCYQLMETDAPGKIGEWMSQWDDLVDFEVVPVIPSARAKEKVMRG